MTNEEAIAYTKSIIVCSGCVDFERNDGCEGCEHMAWWKYIMNILNRQTPNEPKYEKVDNIFDAQKRTCSECGDVVMISPMAMKYENYCRCCGKRLKDWDE